METSYSYTTVSVDSDGASTVNVALRPDRDVSVLCARGRDRAQISISHARAHVTITPTNPTAPTAEDVATARQLAGLFARYAAEVERLHANGASVPGGSVESAA
ncbi:hypothetical protein [Actinomadura sp. K4S16]|uniref:hypothetical protein n=1 Tax=Actinomadura sp. K4S16 TaxID=1316147 RepID=UPI0011EE6302|nr:hypothetical protein [Actinomadura sp. K4S16]